MPLVGSEPSGGEVQWLPSAEPAWEAVGWGHGTSGSQHQEPPASQGRRRKGGRRGEEEEERSLGSCPVCVGTQSCLCVCAPWDLPKRPTKLDSRHLFTTLKINSVGLPLAHQWRIHLECKRFRRCGFDPWVRQILWRRKWQPTPVFLPEESHGQRRGVWEATDHGVAKSQTCLKQLNTHTHKINHVPHQPCEVERVIPDGHQSCPGHKKPLPSKLSNAQISRAGCLAHIRTWSLSVKAKGNNEQETNWKNEWPTWRPSQEGTKAKL